MDLQNYTNVDIFKQVYEKRDVQQHDNMIVHPHNVAKGPVQHSGFNPYTDNFGTTVGKYKYFKLCSR